MQVGAGAGPHRRRPRIELEWMPVYLEPDVFPFRLALQMDTHGFALHGVELLLLTELSGTGCRASNASICFVSRAMAICTWNEVMAFCRRALPT